MNKELHSVTMITHDLKSPLNAILGGLDYVEALLAEDEVDKAEIAELIKMLRTAGGDMLTLIQSVLTAARLEAGKEQTELQPVAGLSTILNEIINTFRYQATINHIQMVADIAPDLPVVYWDIKKIHYHVLNNLVSNALKFVHANGTVKISASAKNDILTLNVADDGPGIPIEERHRIFDKFETAGSKTQRTFDGSGLGLYTANLFIRQHGGAISVHEGLDNKGVTFTITLPAHPTVQFPQFSHVHPGAWSDRRLMSGLHLSNSLHALPTHETQQTHSVF